MQFRKLLFTGLITSLHFVYSLAGVTGSVTGCLKDSTGKPAAYVSVAIRNINNIATMTDDNGCFRLDNVPAGEITLMFSSVEFHNHEKTIYVEKGEQTSVVLIIKSRARELEELVVTGKTEVQEVREQAYNVNAIDARPLHNSNADINLVLNRTTGVRIREDGGLGSNFNFSLNGFSGRQVKFFIDGIPMDNFGSSLTLNNIPINLAERIEVYKGVVPVWLGSDALGGAVNVVTNQKIRNYADVSYSYGSFNTHRASVNTRFTDSTTGFTASLNAFYNHSDNNYIVDVKIGDPLTGKLSAPTPVERFHDAYTSATLQFEVGVTGKKYADRLLFGLIASGNNKDIQNGLNLEKVAGQAYTTDQVFIPTIKYKKENLFTKGLNVTFFASYNMAKNQVVDSSSRIYNWLGSYSYSSYGTNAELADNKTLFHFNDRIILTTYNLSYVPNKTHSFNFNHTYNRFSRQGEDPIAKYPIPYGSPNILTKNVIGMAYMINLFQNKWSTTFFGKLYLMEANVVDASNYEDKSSDVNASYENKGYGIASTYRILPNIQVKASYENAYRLPEGSEMFGDGLLVHNNPYLAPEHSHNANAGVLLNFSQKKHKVNVEANTFYRVADNLIRVDVNGVTSTYVNHRNARITGLDATVKYTYNNFVFFEVNGTYQSIINTTQYEPPGTKATSYIYLDNLPNIPILFGNANVGIQFNNVGMTDGKLMFNFSGLYVQEFYLKWPSLGSAGDKFTIPEQFSQNISVTYSFKKGRYNASAECRNFTDSKVYDNFGLQKPGRSFNVKLRYFINR